MDPVAAAGAIKAAEKTPPWVWLTAVGMISVTLAVTTYLVSSTISSAVQNATAPLKGGVTGLIFGQKGLFGGLTG